MERYEQEAPADELVGTMTNHENHETSMPAIYDSDSLEPTDTIHPDVVPDVQCVRIQIANILFVNTEPDGGEWVLVDAGMPGSADRIVALAEERYGTGARPTAIVLTHGHFDHVGAITDLCTRWNVPVYAHPLEIPYLTGQADYPTGDPSVGGGLMAWISPLYPRDGIDIHEFVRPLPKDGTVPHMPLWRFVHTPGHTPGHVSLFREVDGGLIAGDAFTTVKQESALAVLTQHQAVHGPPAYFTTDWDAAWDSVRRLERLRPAWCATGHGIPMSGESLTAGLRDLAENFDTLAIPKH